MMGARWPGILIEMSRRLFRQEKAQKGTDGTSGDKYDLKQQYYRLVSGFSMIVGHYMVCTVFYLGNKYHRLSKWSIL